MTGILQRFRRDQRGVAAIELALVGGLFILGGMSAVEVGRYAYETSEVNAAAQAGAEGRWWPATSHTRRRRSIVPA